MGLQGKNVLDLGCHHGAMLFELSKLGIHSGLGIEFDDEKVALAREIARLSGIHHLRFQQGDIEQLTADSLGTFDVVLAMSINKHLLNRQQIFRLLRQLTRERLYLEINSKRMPIAAVVSQLQTHGFETIRFLGYCQDDILPAENRRLLFLAEGPTM